MGERAIEYRRINSIPDAWGTAVSVQQMVFGNKGDTSATGVAFSRDEVTGAPEPSGDFLVDAQGEDVVSGVRNTREIAELADVMPAAHAELMEVLRTLEAHYGDMQDTEFTIEEGQLFLLQTRNAKRPAQAAVRFACDAVDEGLLTPAQAIDTIDAGSLDALMHPTFDPGAEYDVLAEGVSASPGAAKGEVVFTAPDAVAAAGEGRDVILVRPRTEADDVAGFHAARGILTSEGGKASHAALVARGMGRPAVVGADALSIDLEQRTITVDGTVVNEGDRIAIDGTLGYVTLADVPLIEAQVNENFERVLGWADELRRLGVRANADDPEGARQARELGAEGIGLCRTEHMFMADDRQPKMRAMIMADGTEERRAALAELLPLQQADFEGLFEAMAGLPVNIRLLDPPLHEFLPNLPGLRADVERARIEESDDLDELERLLTRVEEVQEENPMLGTRGCRLGILYPEIYEMQCHAIMRAVCAVREGGAEAPHPEVMIPLDRLRARARDPARARRAGRRRVRPGRRGRLHGRDDDRAPARVLRRGPDRRALRLLLVRHQRPHADRARIQPRRRRVEVRPGLHEAQHHRSLAVRDDRQAGRRLARAARRVGRARGQAVAQARRLRRARRRPRLDRLLPHGGAGLRLVQPLPDPDSADRRRPGRDTPRGLSGGHGVSRRSRT